MLELLVVGMFATLVLFLLTGAPVAFALAAVGLLFGVVGIYQDLLTFDLLTALPDRVYGIMSNETLLAIPFFTFMGLILERSGMAEDLLEHSRNFMKPKSWRRLANSLAPFAVGSPTR